MSVILKSKAVIAAAVLALGISSVAMAADPKQNVHMFVDTQVILEKSTALQKVREQLDKKAEEFKKDSTSKESYFKKKFEELEKQKSVLSKEAFEQKNNDLAKEFSDAQKKVQESRNTLDKAYTEAMQEFEKVLTDIIKAEAVKMSAESVFPKMAALYIKDNLDMTSTVLEALNKQLPTLTVKFK